MTNEEYFDTKDVVFIVKYRLKHEKSPDCWCQPELEYEDPETGNQVWVHRELQ